MSAVSDHIQHQPRARDAAACLLVAAALALGTLYLIGVFARLALEQARFSASQDPAAGFLVRRDPAGNGLAAPPVRFRPGVFTLATAALPAGKRAYRLSERWPAVPPWSAQAGLHAVQGHRGAHRFAGGEARA
jgi:hypothetical protein